MFPYFCISSIAAVGSLEVMSNVISSQTFVDRPTHHPWLSDLLSSFCLPDLRVRSPRFFFPFGSPSLLDQVLLPDRVFIRFRDFLCYDVLVFFSAPFLPDAHPPPGILASSRASSVTPDFDSSPLFSRSAHFRLLMDPSVTLPRPLRVFFLFFAADFPLFPLCFSSYLQTVSV